jgi:hypothetical protein
MNSVPRQVHSGRRRIRALATGRVFVGRFFSVPGVPLQAGHDAHRHLAGGHEGKGYLESHNFVCKEGTHHRLSED